MCFDENPLTCKCEKEQKRKRKKKGDGGGGGGWGGGLRVSNFAHLLVVFKWHHSSEGVKTQFYLELEPSCSQAPLISSSFKINFKAVLFYNTSTPHLKKNLKKTLKKLNPLSSSLRVPVLKMFSVFEPRPSHRLHGLPLLLVIAG